LSTSAFLLACNLHAGEVRGAGFAVPSVASSLAVSSVGLLGVFFVVPSRITRQLAVDWRAVGPIVSDSDAKGMSFQE
jgi:hypothetical protein